MPQTSTGGHASEEEDSCCPALDRAGPFPALLQSSLERMSCYPVPVRRAAVSPSEKHYQNIQLRSPCCLSHLPLRLFAIV